MWVAQVSKMARRRQGPSAWAISLALYAAAIALRFLLSPWLDPTPFLTFYPAILASTFLCGWRQGSMVLLGSSLAAWYFFVQPVGSFDIDARAAIQLAAFAISGVLSIAIIAAMFDVIRRLETATQMQESLFHELRHRVANNMQIIASMLRIARTDITDARAQETIDRAAARITSMARLNRRLYDRSTYATGLQPILREVLEETFRDYPVDVSLDIRPETLCIDQMTAILMLVNEAALNAAKHVFRSKRGTRFEVSLSEAAEGSLQLIVRDDGPGLGPSASPKGPVQSLGMTIMQAFATQLGGSLEVLEGPGTALRVQFASK